MSAHGLLVAPLLLALAVTARAEAPGVLTRAPAVIVPATPEYPDAAKARGISGEVTLELDVSSTGEVLAARVAKPAGEGFDEAALAAARVLRFSPAEIDGKPAAVTLEYRFRFDAPPPAPESRLGETAASAVLRGRVVERGTRAPLGGVAIAAGEASTFTDSDGRFELAGLPPGPAKVVASDPAHDRFDTEEELEAGKATVVMYYLRRAARDLYEVVVVGEREKKEVSSVSVTSGEVGRIAGVSGDAVKVVQNLPGVARAPGGFGMLVVRGGDPADTRVYVDGMEVPLVFHFGGLTSIVPSELVEAVEFEAGNFGVRYGRATGGRVDLETRDPGTKQLHLVADANLFHALAMAEGPVSENVAVAVAARRSYADAIVTRRRGASTASAYPWPRVTTTTRASSPGAPVRTTPSDSRCSAPTTGCCSPASTPGGCRPSTSSGSTPRSSRRPGPGSTASVTTPGRGSPSRRGTWRCRTCSGHSAPSAIS